MIELIEIYIHTGSVIDIRRSVSSWRARMPIWRKWVNICCNHRHSTQKNLLWGLKSILRRFWWWPICSLVLHKFALLLVKDCWFHFRKYYSDLQRRILILSCCIDKQLILYWSLTEPRELLEMPSHSDEVNAWCMILLTALLVFTSVMMIAESSSLSLVTAKSTHWDHFLNPTEMFLTIFKTRKFAFNKTVRKVTMHTIKRSFALGLAA